MALFGAAGNVISRALVALDLDAHEFNRKLDEADAKLKEHGNIVGKTLHASYLVGAAGIVGMTAVLGESVKVAEQAQVTRAAEQTQLKALGISYSANRDAIDKNVESVRKLSGFNDQQLTASFTRLVATTKNVTKANQDVAIAADIARGRHISLDASTKLVTAAELGRTGALTRLGIQATKVTTYEDKLHDAHVKTTSALREQAKALDQQATSQKLVGDLQAKYAGQAKAFGDTAAGEWQKLKASVDALMVAIGSALLPVISKLLGYLVDLVNRLQDSQRAHELLHRAVALLHDAYNDLVAVLRVILGIVENAIQFFQKHRGILEALIVTVTTLTAAFVVYNATVKAIEIATKAWAAIQTVLNGELDANPIGIVILAIAALTAGIIEAYRHSQTFRDVVHAVFAEVEKIVSATVTFVREHWKLLVSILGGPFVALIVLVATHFGTVKKMVTAIFDWIKDTALKVALAIVEPFSHLPGSMGKWARKAKDAINAELAQTATGAAQAGAAAGGAYAAAFNSQMQNLMGSGNGQAGNPLGGATAVTGGGSISGNAEQAYIAQRAKQLGLDPQAVLAIAHAEGGGFSGAIGDGGHAYGPFQMNNAGGVLTGKFPGAYSASAQAYANSKAGIDSALAAMAAGGARGKTGDAAIAAIIAGYERPGDYLKSGNAYATRDFSVASKYITGDMSVPGQAVAQAARGDGRSGTTHTASVATSVDSSAFDAALAAAPSSGPKPKKPKVPKKPTPASEGSIDAAKRSLAKDYADIAQLHRDGLDRIANAIKPKLAAIGHDLSEPMTTKDLASVKDRMAALKTQIDAGLEKARIALATSTLKDSLVKTMASVRTIQDAGMSGAASALRTQMTKIRDELSSVQTPSDLARVRAQISRWRSTVSAELQKAQAIIASKKTAFEQQWTQFADAALTAFDRETQKNITAMQRTAQNAINTMSVTVNGPNGAFQYAAGDMTPAQQQLQQMQDEHDAAQAAKQLADDQAALAANTDPTQAAQLQAAVDEDLYQARVKALQKTADLEDKAAQDTLSKAQQAAQDQETDLEQNYTDQRDIQRRAFADQLTDLETALETRKATMKNANDVLQLIMAQDGDAIGTAFAGALSAALAKAGLSLADYTSASGSGAAAAATTSRGNPQGIQITSPLHAAETSPGSKTVNVTVNQSFPTSVPQESALASARAAAGKGFVAL